MRVFCSVEPECPADSLQDGFGHPFGVSSLEARVVLDAHAGHKGDLFATEPRDTTTSAEVGDADLVGGEPGPTRRQELPDVVGRVHVSESTTAPAT